LECAELLFDLHRADFRQAKDAFENMPIPTIEPDKIEEEVVHATKENEELEAIAEDATDAIASQREADAKLNAKTEAKKLSAKGGTGKGAATKNKISVKKKK